MTHDDMPDQRAGNLYRLAMFALVSCLAGLLVAGLALPGLGLASSAVKAALGKSDDLALDLPVSEMSQRSTVLMADGTPLAQFYDQDRIYVTLSKIAPVMRHAQVSIEDRRFYEHGAIDLQGTARALLRNAQGTSTQGGSTLTQQYVKQMLISAAESNGDQAGIEAAQAQTVTRKIKELRYATAVERKLSKDQILERYLNIAYYGDGAYGVQAAARHYFGVDAAGLSLPQAAMLAGLVQDPTRTNPVLHPQAAINRRNVVLATMRNQGVITAAQARAAQAVGFDKSKVTTSKKGCIASKYPFLCQYVRKSLEQDPALGKTPTDRLRLVDRGGLTIKTLIDPNTQNTTQRAVSRLVAPTDRAISTSVLIQPGTGLILAMAQNKYVMGSDSKKGETYYNYVVEQSMGGAEGYQAGSTFKAFTAAAALNQGYDSGYGLNSPYSMQLGYSSYYDCTGRFYFGQDYSPSNTTRSEAGYYTMTSALSKSINTYFVQLERKVGICAAAQMAEAMGVRSSNGKSIPYYNQQYPTLTLGILEVTPLSMANAYATIAAHGIHCDPVIIKSITSGTGKDLAAPSANCTRVLSAKVADTLAQSLHTTMTTGTGTPAALDGVAAQAGKSGTTDSNQAVWFNGFTPEVAGVAMIAIDKQTSARSVKGMTVHGTSCDYGCGLIGTGGGDAGRIWNAAMTAALDDYPPSHFSDPDDDKTPEATNDDGTSDVPDITGMSQAQAVDAIQKAGFIAVVQQMPNTKKAGTVLGFNAGHDAKTGATLPPGGTVFIRVSNGQKP